MYHIIIIAVVFVGGGVSVAISPQKTEDRNLIKAKNSPNLESSSP